MKIKTNELNDVALDWAVLFARNPSVAGLFSVTHCVPAPFSTEWALGGPIMESEGISLYLYGGSEWEAHVGNKAYQGPTPLVAAMRCYVASKLGDEVEIPEALQTAQEAV